jgi:hypothetical protein
MTTKQKTRYFLLGTAAVLVAGLCTGLVAYYGHLPGSLFARAAGPEELQYVPADAAVVAYADVRTVMDSEFRNRFRELAEGKHGHSRNELKEKTGIDIEQDVDSATACVFAGGQKAQGGYAVLRGRFDTARLEALALEHGGSLTDYKGHRLVVVTKDHDDDDDEPGEAEVPVEEGAEEGVAKTRHWGVGRNEDHRFALAFVEPGVMVVGSEEAVRRGIDVSEGGSTAADNPELMRLIADVRDDSNMWAVGRADVMTKGKGLPGEVASQIPSLKYFTAAGRVNGGVSARLSAEARDEEAAKNLREVVQGFAALARLQAASKHELQPILQSLQIGGDGNTVQVSFSLPTAAVEDLTRGVSSRRAPRPPQ